MERSKVGAALGNLPVGPWRYFDRLDSTNLEAARWVAQGAPDLALVVADEQTAGRGRLGRSWFTPPGAALAFSLILTEAVQPHLLARLTALGALAVNSALQEGYALATHIKWPNDLLAGGQKLAGLLTETTWEGESQGVTILGIGINVAPASVPADDGLLFPATCVETALGHPIDRWQLFAGVLGALLHWRARLASHEFWQAWEDRLAFRGEWVRVTSGQARPGSAGLYEGRVIGLNPDGALRLLSHSGEEVAVPNGELHLRPVKR
jgi:BirA family biotin operon repressor/biotin-[acetyl-CoA-carboxylase] ligase